MESSEYTQPNAATHLENDLILHWYPKRICTRFGWAESLLELGLGHGFTAELFAKSCSRHVIVDGASAVIDQFKGNHPTFQGEIVLSYFETYTPEEPFDVIIMGFVLEHVDDPDLILVRYREFLKPGGKIYIAVPNAKSLNRRLGLELGLIDDIYSLNDNDIALGHKRQFCRDTLHTRLKKNGYHVTYEEGIYLKPLPLAVLKTLPDFQANLDAMLKVGINFPDLCVGLLMEIIPE
ncbi:bifunctional 2-polyprenyl-6-hydroxyphenol methylase/3-demethylubiquinol 3-O-methyltransferase UbiG [Geminocystis sp. NIES-3709]|uniref:class I SAM-dependent methyltransferase n=1 Tax=Geminocystis sp. NIES-3709 TaxID=1617448 RepID=UPI0005FCBE9B|nr:class I SAM-dependent methyltransferase [Geminocystis sp. NIES-3709]BAQ65658.1 SAM-dependent methyltransferases [Geminocystis sp. NIES-3709]